MNPLISRLSNRASNAPLNLRMPMEHYSLQGVVAEASQQLSNIQRRVEDRYAHTHKYSQAHLEAQELPKPFLDSNGFLIVHCVALRETVASYSTRNELIPFSTINDSSLIEKCKGLPFILQHPQADMNNPLGFVSPQNYETMSKGAIMDGYVDKEKKALILKVRISDEEMIKNIVDKKYMDVSLSYISKDIKKSGEFEGQNYDVIQTNLEPNHLALVSTGRVDGTAISNSRDSLGGNDMNGQMQMPVQTQQPNVNMESLRHIMAEERQVQEATAKFNEMGKTISELVETMQSVKQNMGGMGKMIGTLAKKLGVKNNMPTDKEKKDEEELKEEEKENMMHEGGMEENEGKKVKTMGKKNSFQDVLNSRSQASTLLGKELAPEMDSVSKVVGHTLNELKVNSDGLSDEAKLGLFTGLLHSKQNSAGTGLASETTQTVKSNSLLSLDSPANIVNGANQTNANPEQFI